MSDGQKSQPVAGPQLLRAKTIMQLGDGALSGAVDRVLRDVYQDLKDRPVNDKPRKITIELSFEPNVRNENAVTLEDVEVSFQVTSKVPALGPVHISTRPNDGSGALVFHSLAGTDPNQMTIMDEIDRQRPKPRANDAPAQDD